MRTPALFALFPLLLAAPAPAQDCFLPDAFEPNDDVAVPIGEGVFTGLRFHQGGASIAADDADRFALTLPPHARATVEVEVTGPAGARPLFPGNTLVGNFFESGVITAGFAAPNPFSGYPSVGVVENTTAVPLDVELVMGFAVLTSHPSGCIEYSLSIDYDRRPANTLPDDALEGPDDCASATVLPAGTYSGLVAFGPDRMDGEDADAYRIPNVQPGDAVLVELSLEGEGLQDARLLLTDDPACDGFGTPNGSAYVRNDTGAVRDYYVHVTTESPYAFVRYGLRVDRIPDPCNALPFDPFEPNDDCPSAASILVGTYTDLVLDEGGDVYAVPVPANHRFTARAIPTSPGAEPRVSVSMVPGCPSNGDSVTDTIPTGSQSGTALVRVSGTCGSYDLETSLKPIPCTQAANDSLEPNDTCSTAASPPLVFTATTLHQEELAISGTDVDYLRVVVPPSTTFWYTVDVSSNADLLLQAFPDGDCSATPVEGPTPTPVDDGRVLALPNHTNGPLEYVVRIAAADTSIGCTPYSFRVDTGSIGGCSGLLSFDAQFGHPLSPNASCADAAVPAEGRLTGLSFLPDRPLFWLVSVPAGETLALSTSRFELERDLGAPLRVRFHDGEADCAVGGAALGTALLDPDDPSPTQTATYVNSGSDAQRVLVEVGVAPNRIACAELDLRLEIGPVSAYESRCLPAPNSRLACPCGNAPATASGTGCANSTGAGARLGGSGSASVAADDFFAEVAGAPADAAGLLLASPSDPGQGYTFFDGLLCASFDVQAVQPFGLDASGAWQDASPLAAQLGAVPGTTALLQVWYRDFGGPCGTGSNTTNAIRLVWQP